MPYEPIRCPTCGSVKTIAAENKRFYCASCDGWFAWTDAAPSQPDSPSQHVIEAMQKELGELRKLVKDSRNPGEMKEAAKTLPSAKPVSATRTPGPVPIMPDQQIDAEVRISSALKWSTLLLVPVFILAVISSYDADSPKTVDSKRLKTPDPWTRLVGVWEFASIWNEKGKQFQRDQLIRQGRTIAQAESFLNRDPFGTSPATVSIKPNRELDFSLIPGDDKAPRWKEKWSVLESSGDRLTIQVIHSTFNELPVLGNGKPFQPRIIEVFFRPDGSFEVPSNEDRTNEVSFVEKTIYRRQLKR